MALWYSPSQQTFFDDTINPASQIPSDVQQITPEQHATLLVQLSVPPSAAQSAAGQLVEIDAKKIRAITDAILTGDNTRLTALEQQAVLLRPHVAGG